MRRHHWIGLACMAGIALTAMAAQDPAAQQRFAGTWEAKFKGGTICTIEIKSGERITGSSRACNISVNEEGDLIEPEGSADPDESSPILNAKLDGDILTFETKEKDDEVMKFEMKWSGDGEADLSILGTPVRIKPIHFRRK